MIDTSGKDYPTQRLTDSELSVWKYSILTKQMTPWIKCLLSDCEDLSLDSSTNLKFELGIDWREADHRDDWSAS